MTQDQWRDTAERVAHTFWQGALAAAPITFVPSIDWAEQAALAMGAGGLAAVLALVRGVIRSRGEHRAR